VLEHSSDQIHEVLEFSQFRLKLIEFLKLPLNVSETALREVIKGSSPSVYRNYLMRAKRVEAELGRTIDAPDTSEGGALW
jgi:hypothetical protein